MIYTVGKATCIFTAYRTIQPTIVFLPNIELFFPVNLFRNKH
jgi:hypothetical protein